MSQPLVDVDTAEGRPGKLVQLKAAIEELAEFVELNEPGLISYSVYLVERENQMTGDVIVHDPHVGFVRSVVVSRVGSRRERADSSA